MTSWGRSSPGHLAGEGGGEPRSHHIEMGVLKTECLENNWVSEHAPEYLELLEIHMQSYNGII